MLLYFFLMKIVFIFSCSGMFRDVPECSGMFRNVPCSGFYRRPCKTAAVFCLKIGFTGREARGRHKPVGRVAREIFLVPPQSHSPFPPSLQTFPLTARARVLKPRQKCGLLCSLIPIAICKILSWFNYDRDRIINDDEGITKLRQVLQVFNFLVWGGTSTPPPPPVWIGLMTESRIISMLLFYYYFIL